MSLVSNYVRADDGKIYQNPTLSGDGWFICFDDDDPTELVIKLSSKWVKDPESWLEKVGINHSKLHAQGVSGRMFGKRFKFDDAKSWFFDVLNRIPAKYITENDGTVKMEDIHQGVIEDFDK